MATSTRFTHVLSVEVWDTHFRWREGDVLRDHTVDDTWRRVALGVSGECPGSDPWAQRYAEAFSRWLLLLDEALLRWAGTATAPLLADGCGAALNASAFVVRQGNGAGTFDHRRFADTASLAVRFVADACVRFHTVTGRRTTPRVGLFGVGDALRMLGLDYDSDAARAAAAAMAASLASGCLIANRQLKLKRERGRWKSQPRHPLVALLRRAAASEAPLRHARITAIYPQQRIALLANDTDRRLVALSPREGPLRPRRTAPHAGGGATVDRCADASRPRGTRSSVGMM